MMVPNANSTTPSKIPFPVNIVFSLLVQALDSDPVQIGGVRGGGGGAGGECGTTQVRHFRLRFAAQIFCCANRSFRLVSAV